MILHFAMPMHSHARTHTYMGMGMGMGTYFRIINILNFSYTLL